MRSMMNSFFMAELYQNAANPANCNSDVVYGELAFTKNVNADITAD